MKNLLASEEQTSNLSHSDNAIGKHSVAMPMEQSLLAKQGSHPMFCANKRNMWSRCFNETLRHQKVLQLEKEILEKNALNQV
jgi:hypothetical protein